MFPLIRISVCVISAVIAATCALMAGTSQRAVPVPRAEARLTEIRYCDPEPPMFAVNFRGELLLTNEASVPQVVLGVPVPLTGSAQFQRRKEDFDVVPPVFKSLDFDTVVVRAPDPIPLPAGKTTAIPFVSSVLATTGRTDALAVTVGTYWVRVTLEVVLVQDVGGNFPPTPIIARSEPVQVNIPAQPIFNECRR